MKERVFKSLMIAAALAVPMAVGVGCSHEVSHTETDKPGFFGGSTHEETTTYKNADGTTSTDTQKSKTSN